MSLVQGFLNKIQNYLDKGIIFSLSAFNKESKVSQFIQSMFELMNYSEPLFVCMVVYFDRVVSRHNSLISETNIIKLLFMSGVMAIKVQEDGSHKNSYFAQIGGVSNREINDLEVNFLKWIDFKLNVASEEYEKYYHRLSGLCLIN